MRLQRSARIAAYLAAALVLAGARQAAATPVVSQTFHLQPGWNAIYLEVQPDANSSEEVFAGLPLASAWAWNGRGADKEFVTNPSEGMILSPEWLGYFPRPRPESFLTNLFSVDANRAYLLKIDGASPVDWTVSGRPSLDDRAWVADSFNLTGFHVDPSSPPSFGDFLAPSPAHAGQSIYRLTPAGTWAEVTTPFTTPIGSGVAYWVYTNGKSDYQGPLAVSSELGDGLDFGGSLDQLRLRLHNLADTPANVGLRQLSSPAPVALSYYVFDPDSGDQNWPAMPASLSLPTLASNEQLVDLGVRRAQFAADRVDTVLEVTDGRGYRRFVPISASGLFAEPRFKTSSARAGKSSIVKSGTNPYAGLWVGVVKVDKVSPAQNGSLTPTPTKNDFPLRFIIHVDGNGTVRLLKEVIQVWDNGSFMPSPDNPNRLVVDEPGHYVLLTDQSLIPNFTGAVLRDGVPVGLRLSTAAYDFEPQWESMTGTLSPSGQLAVTLVMGSDDPTNPFKHKYHPDHDNLDAQFTHFLAEAYAVTREMSFQFSATPPNGAPALGYGSTLLGGTYSETLSGLHRNDIVVAGSFLLKRVSARPNLNQ